LALLIADRLDVRRIARPILESTAATIDETVILALYSRKRGQFWAVDAAESSHTIRYIWESLRSWNDVRVGASGKGILAFLPIDEREELIAPLDPAGRTALRAALAKARRSGYVVSHGERFPGAVGVSAPIRDATGRVIGDLIASWPDNRTHARKERSVATAIVSAARDVSAALGSMPPADRVRGSSKSAPMRT
jgi:DNA-binding IclR family transcriptional regulator